MSSTDLAQSSHFQSDPTASLLDNFKRLAIQEGWKKKSKTYKEERRAFLAEGVVTGFWDTFGGNVSSLQAWQSLCKTIGVPESKELEAENAPQLTSISACHRALKGIYVNLVDLVDAGTSGKVISTKFGSQRELAKYILRTGKVFPRDRAKKNPLLRRFLIVVGSRRK